MRQPGRYRRAAVWLERRRGQKIETASFAEGIGIQGSEMGPVLRWFRKRGTLRHMAHGWWLVLKADLPTEIA